MKDIKTAETFFNNNLSTNINEVSGREIIELMREYAEYREKAYHKAKVEEMFNELDRPKIEETLVDYSLSDVHNEYLKSPNLYMHIKLLDKHIDELENKLLNDL